MEPILNTPRSRARRSFAVRYSLLVWHLVHGLRAYGRLQNNPQYDSFRERIEQGRLQLTGEDIYNLSLLFHLTRATELLALGTRQNMSPPPLSVEEEAPGEPVGPVPRLRLRGQAHLSQQRDLARARAIERRGVTLFPLPSLSQPTGRQDLPLPSGSPTPRAQDLGARRRRNQSSSEQLLQTYQRSNALPLVYVNAERVARAVVLLNGAPFPEEPLNQLAREVEIPPNQLAQLLRHLETVVNTYIAEHAPGLAAHGEGSTLFHSLLSMTSFSNVAFAAAGGQLKAAALYCRLDGEITRLRRVEYPRILNLLRRQVHAIGGYIAADALQDQGRGRRLTQQRIPAKTFGVEDVLIPGNLTRQEEYRDLLNHFYQRSNDNDPVTVFGDDYRMGSLRSSPRPVSGLPQVQIRSFPCTCNRGRCTWVPSPPPLSTHCPLHCSSALIQVMDEYLEAYGHNSFVLKHPDTYLFGSLVFGAIGFALFALNGQTEADPLATLERVVQQRAPEQGTFLPEQSTAKFRLMMAAISTVVGFFVQGRLTMRDVSLPASFNYPFPPRPSC